MLMIRKKSLTMTATNSDVSVTVLLSVLCLAMIFVGGWYFQSSLVELKTKQQSFQSLLERETRNCTNCTTTQRESEEAK